MDSWGDSWNGDAVDIQFTKPVDGVPTLYNLGHFQLDYLVTGSSPLYALMFADAGWENSASEQTRTFHPVEYDQMSIVGVPSYIDLLTTSDIGIQTGCADTGTMTMILYYHKIYAFDLRFSLIGKFMEDVGTGVNRVSAGDTVMLQSPGAEGAHTTWNIIMDMPNNATMHWRLCPDSYYMPADVEVNVHPKFQ